MSISRQAAAGASRSRREHRVQTRPWADALVAGWTPAVIAVAISAVAGVAIAAVPPTFLYGGIAAAALAGLCLRWPYAGLMLYMVLEYVRPAERYPVLEPLHLTRIVAAFVLLGWLLKRTCDLPVGEALSARRDAPTTSGRREGNEIWPRGVEMTAIGLMLLVVLGSVPGAFWKGRALDAAMEIARTSIICLMIASMVNTPRRLNAYLAVFVGLHVYLSAGQLFHYVNTSPAAGQLLRVGSESRSFLGEDGDLAMAMAIATPFAFLLVWSRIRPLLRAGCGLAVVVFVCSIVATGSRGGALAFLAALLVTALRSRRRIIAVMLISLTVLTAWSLAPPAYRERISSINSAGSGDESAEARRQSWRAARLMFADNPLLGIGAGNFLDVYVAHYGGSYRVNRTVHSVYYQVASELGLCGIVAFLFLIGAVAVRSSAAARRLANVGLGHTTTAASTAAILPAMTAYLVGGAFQTPLYYPHIYFLAALTFAAGRTALGQAAGGPETESSVRWNSRSRHRRTAI